MKKKASALFFDGVNTPLISAKGEGELAQEIIKIAEECGVPLYENAQLVNLLSSFDVGEEIPEALYFTVAEIISFAYYLQGKTPQDTLRD